MAVGISSVPPDLAIGAISSPALLLRPDGEERRIVLRLRQVRLGYPPKLLRRTRGDG
jgi:hypothetical protein